MADPRCFLEYHRGRVPVFLLGVPIVGQRRKLRLRVHRVGFMRPSIFEFLPKTTGYDAHASCDDFRPVVDVPDGEETVGYWVFWRDRTQGSMVETCDGGVVPNVLGESV